VACLVPEHEPLLQSVKVGVDVDLSAIDVQHPREALQRTVDKIAEPPAKSVPVLRGQFDRADLYELGSRVCCLEVHGAAPPQAVDLAQQRHRVSADRLLVLDAEWTVCAMSDS
jgi:hypothetical protein